MLIVDAEGVEDFCDFVSVSIPAAGVGIKHSNSNFVDNRISPHVALSWLLFCFDLSGVALFTSLPLDDGSAGDILILHTAPIQPLVSDGVAGTIKAGSPSWISNL